MADRTAIEWTDATWNPVKGCTRVKEGCRNCYAEVMAARFSDPGQWGHGLATRVTLPDGRTDHRWTGQTRFDPATLDQPLRWRKPRRIFVCSTGDLFHETVSDDTLDQVFAVMALASQHTFQVLTKRPERAMAYLDGLTRNCADLFNIFASSRFKEAARKAGALLGDLRHMTGVPFPLPHVWLGTSIEDQATADERIPHLLAAPAAVRFISAEPLLGPVDLTRLDAKPFAATINALNGFWHWEGGPIRQESPCLDWVIVGGESDPGARPMHPNWARQIRDQCKAAGVPFFFKQWGEWGHALHMAGVEAVSAATAKSGHWAHPYRYRIHGGPEDGQCFESLPEDYLMLRVGKSRAGRLLDGREWNEFPGALA